MLKASFMLLNAWLNFLWRIPFAQRLDAKILMFDSNAWMCLSVVAVLQVNMRKNKYIYTNARINITNHYLKYCGDGLARSFDLDWIEKLRPKKKIFLAMKSLGGKRTDFWKLN